LQLNAIFVVVRGKVNFVNGKLIAKEIQKIAVSDNNIIDMRIITK